MTERKMSNQSLDAVNDILSGDSQVQYKTEKNSNNFGDIAFSPGLPNEDIMQAIMNNRQIITAHQDVMQKVLNMEWQWFQRRVIKWLGDTPEARSLEESLRTHIKNEKKWIKRGAKADEVGLFK